MKTLSATAIIGLVLLLPRFGNAQTDSLPPAPAVADSVSIQPVVDTASTFHSPRKATILSALLPGAGQIYNRKYWKVPVIYAAFAGMGYLIKFNHDKYKDYNGALIARLDNKPETVDLKYTGKYTDENLRTLTDYYHRNRDLSIAVTALIYALNIIDAHVDAHLYTFDVSDDLSLQVRPVMIPAFFSGINAQQPGLGIKLNF